MTASKIKNAPMKIEIVFNDADQHELFVKLGEALARMAAYEDDARENGET